MVFGPALLTTAIKLHTDREQEREKHQSKDKKNRNSEEKKKKKNHTKSFNKQTAKSQRTVCLGSVNKSWSLDHTHTRSDSAYQIWAFLESHTNPLMLPERYVAWQLAKKNSHTK